MGLLAHSRARLYSHLRATVDSHYAAKEDVKEEVSAKV